MAWSYAGPQENPKDEVRFLIGDTDQGDQLLSDQEIEWVLTRERNTYRAAALACEMIASVFAREVAHSGDGLSWSGNQLREQFEARADALRKMAHRNTKGPIPYAGGISWAERYKADQDPDKIQTHFRSHMHDNPNAGRAPDDELRPRQ